MLFDGVTVTNSQSTRVRVCRMWYGRNTKQLVVTTCWRGRCLGVLMSHAVRPPRSPSVAGCSVHRWRSRALDCSMAPAAEQWQTVHSTLHTHVDNHHILLTATVNLQLHLFTFYLP